MASMTEKTMETVVLLCHFRFCLWHFFTCCGRAQWSCFPSFHTSVSWFVCCFFSSHFLVNFLFPCNTSFPSLSLREGPTLGHGGRRPGMRAGGQLSRHLPFPKRGQKDGMPFTSKGSLLGKSAWPTAAECLQAQLEASGPPAAWARSKAVWKHGLHYLLNLRYRCPPFWKEEGQAGFPQLYSDCLAGVICPDSLLETLMVFIRWLSVFVAKVPWPAQRKDEQVSL